MRLQVRSRAGVAKLTPCHAPATSARTQATMPVSEAIDQSGADDRLIYSSRAQQVLENWLAIPTPPSTTRLQQEEKPFPFASLHLLLSPRSTFCLRRGVRGLLSHSAVGVHHRSCSRCTCGAERCHRDVSTDPSRIASTRRDHPPAYPVSLSSVASTRSAEYRSKPYGSTLRPMYLLEPPATPKALVGNIPPRMTTDRSCSTSAPLTEEGTTPSLSSLHQRTCATSLEQRRVPVGEEGDRCEVRCRGEEERPSSPAAMYNWRVLLGNSARRRVSLIGRSLDGNSPADSAYAKDAAIAFKLVSVPLNDAGNLRI